MLKRPNPDAMPMPAETQSPVTVVKPINFESFVNISPAPINPTPTIIWATIIKGFIPAKPAYVLTISFEMMTNRAEPMATSA